MEKPWTNKLPSNELQEENIACPFKNKYEGNTNVSNEISNNHCETTVQNQFNKGRIQALLPHENPEINEYLNALIEGFGIPVESLPSMESRPEWFDARKFVKGQEVANKFLFSSSSGTLLSLMMFMTIIENYPTLIFTGKSDTPFKAFKRYLSTSLLVKSWYTDDIWNPTTEGYKNMKKVRETHTRIRKILLKTDREEYVRRTTLTSTWSPLHEDLKEDLKTACPVSELNIHDLRELAKNHVVFNQTEMALTQFSMLAIFVAYPEWVGAHGISEDELDSFVYTWRCIGYLLGQEDKYNFCNGNLQTVKERISVVINCIVKPSLQEASRVWEHMARCMTEGIGYYSQGVEFESSFFYLCDILGLETPRSKASLTWKQKFSYYTIHFISWYLLKIPGAHTFFNNVIERSLRNAVNASPEWIKQLQEKKYPFQDKAV